MDKDLYDKGMQIRREVLGDAYVDRALAKANEFNDPLQELVTTYCWGWNWGREGLPRRDRSLINLAMIAVLNRDPLEQVHHAPSASSASISANASLASRKLSTAAGMPP